MDGLELQRILKSFQAGILVLFKARGDSGRRRLAVEEGAADFLNKPFEADSLLLALRTVQARIRMQADDAEPEAYGRRQPE